MNKIVLIGRITGEVYLNNAETNTQNVKFFLAVNREIKDAGVDYIPIIAWGQTASFVSKYLQKGDLISIDGRFSSSQYEKDGEKINKYEITAFNIKALESKEAKELRLKKE